MKLRHKLLLAFLLLAVVPLAAVVALFQLSFTPQAERLVGSRLQDNAAQTAQLLDEFVATCVRDFRALAAAEEMVSDSPAVVADHLARHTHAYPHFRRVMLADTSGVIVASSDPGTTGRRLVELHGELADDFRTVLQHPPGRMQVSDLTDLADAAAPDAPPPLDLQLLLRVQDEAGRPRGVLVAVMESRRLLEQIDDIDRRMPAEVPGYLLDRGGRVLLTRDASANPLGAYPDVEPVLEHLRATNWHGEGWLTQPHVHEQEVLTAYAVTSEFGDNRAGRWLVVLRAPRHVVMAPVDFITSRVLALLLGVLAVAAGVSFWLARPVTDLARLVERLRKGDLSARALVARRGEAGLVARELNEMAAAVQHRTRQLTESEAKWRTLFDEATDGLILVDPATQTFRQVNRSICRMLGTTEAELVARGLDGIPPAEQLPAVQETFARMGLGTQKAAVLPLLRKHGGVLLADVTASILEVGGQRLLLAAFRDITERRRMEESLRQNEERLQLSLHAAKAGIWDWDIPADRTVWSARCYALYGLPPSADPLKLEGWLALVHPDDRDRVAERARQTLAERRTAFAQEYRIVHPQEGLRWLSDTGQVTFDAAGTPLRAIGLIFDVTERKQAEAELERMRVLLSEGLRIARCGVFEYVPATGEMIWSEEQFRIYGLPPGPRSPSFHDLVHEHLHPADAARVEQAFQAAVQGGATFDIEHRIVRHDGTVRDVHDVAHPYFDAQGKVLKYTGATLDVTERKRTQETLDEARRRLETIVTSSTAMLYACQATGNFDATFVSRNFQAVTGHTEEDFLAEGFWASHLHPEDAPRVLTGVATVFEKKMHRHQYRFRFKDGTYHWMEDEFRLLEDGAGRPVEICGTWIDITDRKRAETELERHHHHLEEVVAERTAALQVKNSVFDASLAANSIADLHGVLTEVNDAFLRSWGYADKTQVVGTPMSRFLQDPGEAATIIAALDGTGVWEGDFTARRKDGSTFLARGGATVLRDERGTAIGYQSAVLDITERKKAENALQELAGRLERATQAGKVGVWDYDIVRNRLVWDDQMFRLYGVARDRFLGAYEAWENGLHPDDRQSAVTELQAALRGDKEFDTEFRVVWPDGSLRHIKAAGTVQRDGAGKAVRMVGTNMDITERRAAEEALRAAKQAADAASRAKSAFLANMSHEIRTPLNAILGYAQLLQRDPSLSADAREDLETINRSGEHLLGLINSVLEMSKIDAGRVTVQATTFSLHGMLADLASLFRGRTEAKGLTFETVRLGEVPDRVVADEGKVRQVLTNLLGNAVKFTERGGIVLRTSSGKDGAGQLRLAVEVEDTGPGIGEEDLGRLFQHFEQTASGRQVQAGTGLGLAISRAHARLVGGDVTVTSQVGRGSVFRLEVPVQVTAESVVAPTTIRRRVSGLAPGQNAWRVLVADDSAANRGWVTKLLASVGFQVREAADGRETVEAWRQWKPHLVLMDMRMPVLDGYQATRQIRASPGGAETRIIAATASVFEETRQAMTDAGVDGFLGKPIQEADLFQKIQEHLRLDYLFGADEAPTAGPAPAPAVKPESLARLPAETKARMRSAIHSGDMEQLNGLILQVATLDETLASALRSLADRYEYDALSTLLTPESAR